MGNYLGKTVTAAAPPVSSAMRIRLSHENKACDLTMTHTDTLGALKNTAHQIFKIAYNRVRLVHDGNDLSEHPDETTLPTVGIDDNSIVHAEVLPPRVVQKKQATPEEVLIECEKGATEIKATLDALLQRVIDSWKEGEPEPSEEELRVAQHECALQDELLTRIMLRMDGIEVDDDLRVRRRALLKVIQGLQDGDCNVVKEAIASRASKE
eukprot:TRINITY_DN20591_c0_g1_i1.p1 TRINITY_DN20591_c0_g1~~TRINITY_DN20591_c0_g1_i1.p1  ORF type:complete len:210 (+),score=57.24 TRINITY_DN20591_c0_g1_i1:170-799(+)